MTNIFSFQAIASYFNDKISLLPWGEINYESLNVLNVLFDGTIPPMILNGMVSAVEQNVQHIQTIIVDFPTLQKRNFIFKIIGNRLKN
jgi:hypothetical protein